jgi:hypothetical protein
VDDIVREAELDMQERDVRGVQLRERRGREARLQARLEDEFLDDDLMVGPVAVVQRSAEPDGEFEALVNQFSGSVGNPIARSLRRRITRRPMSGPQNIAVDCGFRRSDL